MKSSNASIYIAAALCISGCASTIGDLSGRYEGESLGVERLNICSDGRFYYISAIGYIHEYSWGTWSRSDDEGMALQSVHADSDFAKLNLDSVKVYSGAESVVVNLKTGLDLDMAEVVASINGEDVYPHAKHEGGIYSFIYEHDGELSITLRADWIERAGRPQARLKTIESDTVIVGSDLGRVLYLDWGVEYEHFFFVELNHEILRPYRYGLRWDKIRYVKDASNPECRF